MLKATACIAIYFVPHPRENTSHPQQMDTCCPSCSAGTLSFKNPKKRIRLHSSQQRSYSTQTVLVN